MVWRQLHQAKRMKPTPRIKLQKLGLPARKHSATPIEEIRRQGRMLAGSPADHAKALAQSPSIPPATIDPESVRHPLETAPGTKASRR
jgi:hypothetical protein